MHFTAQEREKKVVIDAELDTKKIIHAEIDYGKQTLLMRSVSSVNGQLVEIESKDIIVFQKLLVSVPQRIDTASQLGDALTSFLTLMASAPSGTVLDIGG